MCLGYSELKADSKALKGLCRICVIIMYLRYKTRYWLAARPTCYTQLWLNFTARDEAEGVPVIASNYWYQEFLLGNMLFIAVGQFISSMGSRSQQKKS